MNDETTDLSSAYFIKLAPELTNRIIVRGLEREKQELIRRQDFDGAAALQKRILELRPATSSLVLPDKHPDNVDFPAK
ncbi:MAG: UvrB/UvrC motif-containing protein [bacterium]|nr:UvrB/UvrC motif-containing protein [bacterium]